MAAGTIHHRVLPVPCQSEPTRGTASIDAVFARRALNSHRAARWQTNIDIRNDGKTVTLEVFQSEPLARMAAHRLEAEGIRCMVRAVGVGPGGWGLAANVPHALDTWEEDAVAAREILNLMPAEIEERTRGPVGGDMSLPRLLFLGVLALVAIALVVQVADSAFGWLLG